MRVLGFLSPPLDRDTVRVMNAMHRLLPKARFWTPREFIGRAFPGIELYVGRSNGYIVRWSTRFVGGNPFTPLSFYAKQLRRLSRSVNAKIVWDRR